MPGESRHTTFCVGDRWVAGRVTNVQVRVPSGVVVMLWCDGVRELTAMSALKVKPHNMWRTDRFNDWPKPRKLASVCERSERPEGAPGPGGPVAEAYTGKEEAE